MVRKFFVGGNFKMNGSLESLTKLVEEFNQASLDSNTETIISPPSLYLVPLAALAKNGIQVAAQNASQHEKGAYTGEISITQLKDIGLSWVILGHSERRTLYHEDDDLVAAKTLAAIKAGLKVILCVGENLEERESEKTTEVVTRQLASVKKILSEDQWANIVIAYEPVWAIGTGKVATPKQAQDTHADIRKYLSSEISSAVGDATRIIYGGSVNADNCKELGGQADIDGFLVGGASLTPRFVEIINARIGSKL